VVSLCVRHNNLPILPGRAAGLSAPTPFRGKGKLA
jgi:hypothetical protein